MFARFTEVAGVSYAMVRASEEQVADAIAVSEVAVNPKEALIVRPSKDVAIEIDQYSRRDGSAYGGRKEVIMSLHIEAKDILKRVCEDECLDKLDGHFSLVNPDTESTGVSAALNCCRVVSDDIYRASEYISVLSRYVDAVRELQYKLDSHASVDGNTAQVKGYLAAAEAVRTLRYGS